MTTRPSHAALVEEVARHMLAARGLDYDASDLGKQTRPEVGAAISTARYIFSLIFARLSDMTPEMVEAVAKAVTSTGYDRGERPFSVEQNMSKARAAIIAYLAASPLTPGENGEG